MQIRKAAESAEASRAAVVRSAHVAAVLTVTCHYPDHCAPAVNPINSVYAATAICSSLLFQQFQPVRYVYEQIIQDSLPRTYRQHCQRSQHTYCTRHRVVRYLYHGQLLRHRCSHRRLPPIVQVLVRNNISALTWTHLIQNALYSPRHSTSLPNFACAFCVVDQYECKFAQTLFQFVT